MTTLSENLTELIAQKDRIASEVNSQGEKITAIKSDIYDILETDEIPQSKLASVVDKTVTEIMAQDLDGATKIGQYAFYSCSSLTNVTIPNTVTKIEMSAFEECRQLNTIIVPASVTSISVRAFLTYGNPTIRFLGTTPPTLASGGINANYLKKIIVPKGYGEVYKSATNFSNLASKIVEASE